MTEVPQLSPSSSLSSLSPADKILEAAIRTSGLHIGNTKCSVDMKKFVEETRSGVSFFDPIKMISRIRGAANMMSKVEPYEVIVYSDRMEAVKGITRFGELTGVKGITGRYLPGTITNPSLPSYLDTKVLMVLPPNYIMPKTDNLVLQQVVIEASDNSIPIIGICNSNNPATFVDLVVPSNTRGHRALALLFWLFSREVLVKQGRLGKEEMPTFTLEEFESPLPEVPEASNDDEDDEDSDEE